MQRRLPGSRLVLHEKIRVIKNVLRIQVANTRKFHVDLQHKRFWFSFLFRLVDKDCYPWTGQQDQCRLRKKTNLRAAGCRNPPNPLRKELYKVGPAYRLGNETDIMQEILTSGPVQGKREIMVVVDVFLFFIPTDHTCVPLETYLS